MKTQAQREAAKARRQARKENAPVAAMPTGAELTAAIKFYMDLDEVKEALEEFDTV